MKKRILLDCDGVLADFCSLCFDFIEKNIGKKFAHEDVKQWDVFEALGVKYLENDFRSYISSGGKCSDIAPYVESISAVHDLKKDFEIVVVTSPLHVTSWVVERTDWLKRHFGFKKEDIIFATRKECVTGDFLIDDHVENCSSWKEQHHKGVSLLWDAPYNRSKITKSLGVTRVHGWDEVKKECYKGL
jgi:5'(3')-deoxyribonucleotidase